MNIKLNRQKRPSSKNKNLTEDNHLSIALLAAKIAEEKKGENILLLDVSKLTVLSDYFLIATAKSTPQINAIAKSLEESLRSVNYRLISKEGFVDSNWVVLDFGNLIVHIMNEKERNYYKLEKFWSNATLIDEKQWKKAS